MRTEQCVDCVHAGKHGLPCDECDSKMSNYEEIEMKYKIYIAASYPNKNTAKLLADELVKAGHIIVSNWIYRDEGYASDDRVETKGEEMARMSNAAIRDLFEVKSCELLINLSDGDVQLTRGGRHTELGIALALNKEIVVIGKRESVFHYCPHVKVYKNMSDFIYDFAPELMA